jgi:hypothetical protein
MQTAALMFLGVALGGDPPAVQAPSFTEQAIRSPAIPMGGSMKSNRPSYDTTKETIQRLLHGLFPNDADFAPPIGDPLPPPRKRQIAPTVHST